MTARHAWRPILVVAAHPDDETIGAGGLLVRAGSATLVHLTDGTPRDRRFWPSGQGGTPGEYARLRREELEHALARGGVRDVRLRSLGASDQEAVDRLASLARGLVRILHEERPSLLVTHPYEGGHPDHDAAAFVCEAAVALLGRDGAPAPVRVEMTSYHARAGVMETGTFLDQRGPEVVHVLEPGVRDRKARMLESFRSQREVLEAFLPDVERFRRAPAYDFTAPPCPGRLLYETWEFPVTGQRWRERVVEAQRDLRRIA